MVVFFRYHSGPQDQTSAFILLFHLSQIESVVPVLGVLYLLSENDRDYCHDKANLVNKDMAALTDGWDRECECMVSHAVWSVYQET